MIAGVSTAAVIINRAAAPFRSRIAGKQTVDEYGVSVDVRVVRINRAAAPIGVVAIDIAAGKGDPVKLYVGLRYFKYPARAIARKDDAVAIDGNGFFNLQSEGQRDRLTRKRRVEIDSIAAGGSMAKTIASVSRTLVSLLVVLCLVDIVLFLLFGPALRGGMFDMADIKRAALISRVFSV
jgi:hypothetical protein